jgi:dimethylamine monooxygenase subunit A
VTVTPDLMSAPDLVRTFPFPFPTDSYRYSTNVEPAGTAVVTPTGQWGDRVVDVDSEYEHELAERARILAEDPSRHTVLPHMRTACWDAMLTLMRELASAYPDTMSLTAEGAAWRWRNERLGLTQDFVLGDESTLPGEPLAYIAGQVQEDIVLLDQRDGDLFGDAGVVTFAADWSFGFDVGMTFLEIHGPVPRLRETGVITRARQFLMRLHPNETYRRTNWTLTIGRRLDVSTELYHEWGPDRPMIQTVDDATFGRLVHLRVEVQHLIRLPESGAICFLIRTYMLPFADLATIEPWRQRTAAVLADLPDDMADYKGVISYRDRAVSWLESHAPDN